MSNATNLPPTPDQPPDAAPPPDVPPDTPPDMITIHIRRRPLYEWLGWLIWLIVLGVLLEFCLVSFREHEGQAGVLAGALFLFLLLAGLIVEGMHQADLRSQYRQIAAPPPDQPLTDVLDFNPPALDDFTGDRDEHPR
jgi:hypothetical protein